MPVLKDIKIFNEIYDFFIHQILAICYNGTYRNVTSNLCEKCPVGEYQPMDLQESCMKCKVNFTTKAEGKNSESDCKCKGKIYHITNNLGKKISTCTLFLSILAHLSRQVITAQEINVVHWPLVCS